MYARLASKYRKPTDPINRRSLPQPIGQNLLIDHCSLPSPGCESQSSSCRRSWVAQGKHIERTTCVIQRGLTLYRDLRGSQLNARPVRCKRRWLKGLLHREQTASLQTALLHCERSADPDANRSAGLHSYRVVTADRVPPRVSRACPLPV